MKNDTAIIRQLVPYADRWEFVYMFRNANEIGLQRVPMLGLALIDFPRDGEFEPMIVHFGTSELGEQDHFSFYTPYAWHCRRFLYPFFLNGPQTRALGVAPVGSSDDYFEEEAKWAREQLEAEAAFDKDFRGLLRKWEAVMGGGLKANERFHQGLDNLFAITTGRYRDQATRADWTQVFDLLKSKQSAGDSAVVSVLVEAAEYPSDMVEDTRFSKMAASN